MKILSLKKLATVPDGLFTLDVYEVTYQTGIFFKKTHTVRLVEDWITWRNVDDMETDWKLTEAIRKFKEENEKNVREKISKKYKEERATEIKRALSKLDIPDKIH